MLETQVISIALAQGVNTKVDPKQTALGELNALQNGIFITPKEIKKRNGYNALVTTLISGGGSISSGNNCSSFGNSLVLGDNTTLYSYSENESQWVNKGYKTSLSLSSTAVGINATSTSSPKMALHSSGVELVVWENTNLYFTYMDSTTSSPIVTGSVTTTCVNARAFVFVNNFAVLSEQRGTTNQLNYALISATAPVTTMNLSSLVSLGSATAKVDAVQNSTNLFVVYDNAANSYISIANYNSSLSIVGSPVVIASSVPKASTVVYDGFNNYLWVFWADGSNLNLAIYNTSLTQIRAATVLGADPGIRALGGISISANVTNVYAEVAGTSSYLNYIKRYSYNNNTATLTTTNLQYSVGLAGKPFQDGALNTYIPTQHQSTLQSTYFLIRDINPLASTDGGTTIAAKLAENDAGNLPNSIGAVVNPATNQYVLPYISQVNTTIVNGVITSNYNVNLVKYTFKTKSRSLALANNLNSSGGVLTIYDGKGVAESGFHLFPENLTNPLNFTAGGGVNNGTFSYVATYEWTDNEGNRHRSAPGPAPALSVNVNTNLVAGVSYISGSAGLSFPGGNSPFQQFVLPGSLIQNSNVTTGTFVGIQQQYGGVSGTMSANATGSATNSTTTFVPQLNYFGIYTGSYNGVTNSAAVASTNCYKYIIAIQINVSNSKIYVNTINGVAAGMSVYAVSNFGASTINSVGTDSGGSFIVIAASPPSTTTGNCILALSMQFVISFTNGSTSATVTSGPTQFLQKNFYIGNTVGNTGSNIVGQIASFSGSSITLVSNFPNSTGSYNCQLTFPVSSIFVLGQELTGSMNNNTAYPITALDTVNNAFVFGQVPQNPTTTGTSVSFTSQSLSTVQINVPGLDLSETYKKPNVIVNLWRTVANGTLYYKCATASNVSNGTVSIIDYLSDAYLITNEQLYTNGGEVENIAPPATDLMTSYKNRIIAIQADNPFTWWYSKQVINQFPVEFSDLFTQTIDQRGGPITAVAAMDDKLIFFKEFLIFYVFGDGPTPSGANNDFSYPQIITTDVGCINPDSVVLTPTGLMFQSHKGIYLLDRGLGTSYIGAKVEAYNSYTATSATLVPNTTQVRFSMNNSVILLFDYFLGNWSVFTNLAAVDSTIYNDQYVILSSAGMILEESPNAYSDNGTAIVLSLTTSWLSLAQVQGFQRVKILELLSECSNTTTLSITFAYDFLSTLNQTITDTIAASSDPVPQRFFLPRQKCSAVQITITDSPSSPYVGTLSFSNLALEVGVKKGLNKLTAAQSHG